MTFLGLETPYVVLSLTIVAATFYVVYHTVFSPLARVPGPFLAKFSQLYLVYFHLSGQAHRKLMKLHEKHGNVVRTGPSTL
jgi:hypothetical protein